MAGTREDAGCLQIPFIFTPNGQTPTPDWLAVHPGSIAIPATFAADGARRRFADASPGPSVAPVGAGASGRFGGPPMHPPSPSFGVDWLPDGLPPALFAEAGAAVVSAAAADAAYLRAVFGDSPVPEQRLDRTSVVDDTGELQLRSEEGSGEDGPKSAPNGRSAQGSPISQSAQSDSKSTARGSGGIPLDAVEYESLDGTKFYAPPSANFPAIRRYGNMIRNLPLAERRAAIGAAVGQGGFFDFQRIGGSFHPA